MSFAQSRIIESWIMVERKQRRFPRSKKRRIRRKWARQEKNWVTVPMTEIYRIGDNIFCHPAIAQKIRIETRTRT